jgi:pimeloyl-ACP methyl ester carboxylesterase
MISTLLPPSRLTRWKRTLLSTVSLAVGLAALTGCTWLLRGTPIPIPTLPRPLSTTGRTDTLVVFLPGSGDTMADYERQGMVTALREAGVKTDAVIVDAHLGYYYKRTVVERLRADVLLPARQRGYHRIVVVGVSLGGLGGLLCERDFPGSIDALVLLGPYLGEDNALFDRVDRAGGPKAWATGREPQTGKVDEQLWAFLGTKSAALPPTWLLRGENDKYARGQRLLAGLLPATRVTTIAGGHDWTTWRALWHEVCFQSEVFRSERSPAP